MHVQKRFTDNIHIIECITKNYRKLTNVFILEMLVKKVFSLD